MSIQVYQCQIQIATKELGLTRDRFTQSYLRRVLERRISLAGWQPRGSFPNPPNLEREIANFAERRATGATHNVDSYFAQLPAAGYTAGGRRATSQALLYLKDILQPSSSDVPSVGEGIAGYYLEVTEGLWFEARPFGVSPDFVFKDPSTARTILVEVKSGLHQGRLSITDAIRLMEIMAKTKFISAGRYAAYVIRVNILMSWEFEIYRLSVEEV